MVYKCSDEASIAHFCAMRRLFWLTENYPPERGGMAQSCDRIVDGLRRAGYTIDLLHFTRRGTAYVRRRQERGSYTPLGVGEDEAHTLQRALLTMEARAAEADALVAFGGYLPLLGAPVYARWLGLPLLVLLRGNDWDTGIFSSRKRKMLDDALQTASAVGAVSRKMQQQVRAFYPLSCVAYTPNGLDLAQWRLMESDRRQGERFRAGLLGEEQCLLGLFGQLKAKKGADWLLDALEGYPQAAHLHLLLVGEAEAPLLERLEAAGIAHTHLPFRDRFELLPLLCALDALLLPSFYDGMPNVLLEAGALGVPVLGSAVGGISDVLAEPSPELLFPPGNAAALREILHRFLSADKPTKTHWGRRLQWYIQQYFHSQNEIDHYHAFFQTLEDRGGSA
jgi:glycosyltransferase involved in cell wall biosynthesis